MKYYVGIDVGATTTKLGLLDENQNIVGDRCDISSQTNIGPTAAVQTIKNQIQHILKKNDIAFSQVAALGASFPTPVSAQGHVLHPTNIDPSWKNVNVKHILEEALHIPIVLLNDGEAAAYREYSIRKKINKATKSMTQFITGTGLGGAVILDGTILTGDGTCIAGELGHIISDTSPTADTCGCGAIGCVETRASLTGLVNLVKIVQTKKNIPPFLTGNPKNVAKTLRALIQISNPHSSIVEIWHKYFTHLGRAARSIANILGCNLIVISGGAQERETSASNTGYQLYLTTAINIIKKEITSSFPHLENVLVEWSIDKIPDSATYGAAAYATKNKHIYKM